MTRNQIDWQNMMISRKRAKEEARHNLITEREVERSNRAKEAISLDTLEHERNKLSEAIRHNNVGEYLDQLKIDETRRSNLAAEANKRLDISTSHLDRSEANRISKEWNQVQKNLKLLESELKKDLGQEQNQTAAQKVANDLSVAMQKLEIDKFKTAVGASNTMSNIIKNVTGLLRRK